VFFISNMRCPFEVLAAPIQFRRIRLPLAHGKPPGIAKFHPARGDRLQGITMSKCTDIVWHNMQMIDRHDRDQPAMSPYHHATMLKMPWRLSQFQEISGTPSGAAPCPN
jgi:hypothetical protein